MLDSLGTSSTTYAIHDAITNMFIVGGGRFDLQCSNCLSQEEMECGLRVIVAIKRIISYTNLTIITICYLHHHCINLVALCRVYQINVSTTMCWPVTTFLKYNCELFSLGTRLTLICNGHGSLSSLAVAGILGIDGSIFAFSIILAVHSSKIFQVEHIHIEIL